MKQNRKQIKTKMAAALDNNMETLSAEMKDILLDDLVTAFENRFKVLNQASNVHIMVDLGEKIHNETLQA